MAVNFYLDKRTDKNGDANIRVSVNIRGTRLLTNSGCKIAPSKWDAARQKVRHGCTNGAGLTYFTLNTMLSRIVDHFAAYENECYTQGGRTNVEILKHELACIRNGAEATEEVRPLTFFEVFDEFVTEMGQTNEWTPATKQKFSALRHHLYAWNPRLTFEQLDERTLTAWIAYLRNECGMKNSTIGKQWGFTKWFLRWATTHGYNSTMAFQAFAPKLKTAQKKVIFLEWEELMRVLHYEIPANGTVVQLTTADGRHYEKTVEDASALRKTRDIFCFCCFTSLRYSDAANLKWANITGDAMTLTTIKTADTITIELNKYARAILDKYAAEKSADGCVFPHLTNQRMNYYLKHLCELCEINQPVTQTYYCGSRRVDEVKLKYEMIGTHAGRRTFICNALMLGIPAQIVMKWTGHSDYKAMRPYVDIADAAKAEAMKRFDGV